MIQLLREINFWLGVVTFAGLCWRTPQALMGVASKRLYLALCMFPIGVTFGSVYALQHNFPPSPTAPYFTVAYVALGVVLIWWPKRLDGVRSRNRA